RAASLAAEPAPQKRRAPRKVASKALPPLTEIKGIGDAMTRRLEQAGIHTLADLAHTSPDAIRERLGPVSTLANVEAWQEQASSLLP
ncbi:MAG: helix-hairpin-helix domain-containing protein, partial [Pseudomonadota bacterium]